MNTMNSTTSVDHLSHNLRVNGHMLLSTIGEVSEELVLGDSALTSGVHLGNEHRLALTIDSNTIDVLDIGDENLGSSATDRVISINSVSIREGNDVVDTFFLLLIDVL